MEADQRACLIWAKKYSVLFSSLSFNITREVCSYLSPHLTLAYVQEDSLSFVNFATFTLYPAVELHTTVQVNHNSSWAVVNRNLLVLCGGGGKRILHIDNGKAWRSAYLLHSQGRVKALPDLLFGRSGSGVVVWKGAVHVFGSLTDIDGKRCERLGLAEDCNWESLPLLSSKRCCFTPVVWQGAIYLSGGCNFIEIWDGQAFKKLSDPQISSSFSVSCTHGNKLHIFGNTRQVVLSQRSDTDAISFKTYENTISYSTYCTNPVISGEMLVHLSGGRVFRESIKID